MSRYAVYAQDGAIQIFLSEGVSTLAVVQVSERGKASYDAGKLANSNCCLPNPPPPLVATTRTRGVRVVSTGATGLASRRTPASVSNHHVAPPFPQGARRCSASAPLGVGSRRAAAIPGGECTHPQFVHGRGHAPAFGRFAHVSPSPLVARQSEFCGSRPSLSLGRCAVCGSSFVHCLF